MIGVDTNVLVRAVLGDEPLQARIATALLEQEAAKGKLFISVFALLELAWVLKTRTYSRQEIAGVVRDLIESEGVVVSHRTQLLEALGAYQAGTADFGDYLILADGRGYAAHRLATFDRALLREPSCVDPAELVQPDPT